MLKRVVARLVVIEAQLSTLNTCILKISMAIYIVHMCGILDFKRQ